MRNARASRRCDGIRAEKQRRRERLSAREFEVFRLLGRGKTVTEIAHRLNLSVKTVSTHRSHILAKTTLRTNADIADYVTANGLR